MSFWLPMLVTLAAISGGADAGQSGEAAPAMASTPVVAEPGAGLCSLTQANTVAVATPASPRADAVRTPVIYLKPGASTPIAPPAPTAKGAALEAWRASDGLFYVTGLINGQAVRFLVDTGASAITLTAADAARVNAVDSGEAPWIAETAAGRRTMRRVRLSRMEVGASSAEDVPAAVAPEGLGVSLLGANWIAHVSSMTIEGDRMLIR